MAMRLVPTGKETVQIRVALPPQNARQNITALHVTSRGLQVTKNQDDANPHLLLSGKLRAPKRVAVTYRVLTSAERETVPPLGPLSGPTAGLVPYLAPAPLFQARSLLVREFLETHVAPKLSPDADGVMRAILTATRAEITRRSDGKSLALDVIRRRRGKRIGIERAFTTFLRCAGIPARFVEGINLKSKTHRKRVFWTEAWGQGRWWPVSASAGWIGRLPERYLAVALDGTRVLSTEGPVEATYDIHTFRIETVNR